MKSERFDEYVIVSYRDECHFDYEKHPNTGHEFQETFLLDKVKKLNETIHGQRFHLINRVTAIVEVIV